MSSFKTIIEVIRLLLWSIQFVSNQIDEIEYTSRVKNRKKLIVKIDVAVEEGDEDAELDALDDLTK